MTNSLAVLLCACTLAGVLGGCSSSPVPPANTTETITVSEQGKNSPCVATVTVQEGVNGKTHSLHQANVPCGNVKSVEAKLVAQAKQGLQ
jgi:hypothetical protein